MAKTKSEITAFLIIAIALVIYTVLLLLSCTVISLIAGWQGPLPYLTFMLAVMYSESYLVFLMPLIAIGIPLAAKNQTLKGFYIYIAITAYVSWLYLRVPAISQIEIYSSALVSGTLTYLAVIGMQRARQKQINKG